jgi:hypothetical protein
MVALPAVPPVTIPEEEPIDAVEGALLLQVPPPKSLSVVVPNEHTTAVPRIAEGNGLTVSGIVTKQPPDS